MTTTSPECHTAAHTHPFLSKSRMSALYLGGGCGLIVAVTAFATFSRLDKSRYGERVLLRRQRRVPWSL